MEFSGWKGISSALAASDKLLDATIRQEADIVAEELDRTHMENTSVLTYNNETALSCVITIAYYTAQKDYTLIRECPSGNTIPVRLKILWRLPTTPASAETLRISNTAGSRSRGQDTISFSAPLLASDHGRDPSPDVYHAHGLLPALRRDSYPGRDLSGRLSVHDLYPEPYKLCLNRGSAACCLIVIPGKIYAYPSPAIRYSQIAYDLGGSKA